MAVDIATLVVAFIALLGGAVARAAYPFMQEQKNKEDELRALELIPPDKLTEEQKQFIENSNKPINFLKYYKYTAILGLGASVAITMSSLTVALNSLPPNSTFDIVVSFIPVLILTGWGGGGLSNQLIKSGATPVKNVSKVILSSIGSSDKTKQVVVDDSGETHTINPV